MKGAFQTSREIFDNPIWQDVPKFRIFFYIYGNAVFSEEGVRIGDITVKRGQYLRSYRNLISDLEYIENKSIKKYSVSVIKRKVDQLVKENRLKIEDTEYGTLFTVVNYEEYQGFERYKKDNVEQRRNSVGTAEEQQRNNNNNVIKDIKDNIKNISPSADVGRAESIDYEEEVKQLLARYQKSFIETNKDYWEMIKETRKTKTVSKSVILRVMKSWEKYDPIVVEYSLKTHTLNYAGRKEEYTIGIMRGTSKEEAEKRIETLGKPKNNFSKGNSPVSQKPDLNKIMEMLDDE